MTLNPVIWAAWLLERWTRWRLERPDPAEESTEESTECGEGLNIHGRIMTDISEFRVIGKRSTHGEHDAE